MTLPDPGLERKLRSQAFLRRNHRVFTPLIIVLGLAFFILPWLLASFLGALALQIAGVCLLWAIGKQFTTAFDRNPPTQKPDPEDIET